MLPSYSGPLERIWYYALRAICGLILLFLIMPVLVIIPLSFNAEPYFSFTSGMLSLESDAYSMRWYLDIINNKQWVHSAKNSLIIAFFSTIIATTLGTIAALGLSRPEMPYRGVIMGLLISPMIVPLIISAAGMYFFLFFCWAHANIYWYNPCTFRTWNSVCSYYCNCYLDRV